MKKSSKQAHKKLMARCEAAESALDKAEAAYAKAQTDANWNAKQKALAKCDRLWNKLDGDGMISCPTQDWRRWKLFIVR